VSEPDCKRTASSSFLTRFAVSVWSGYWVLLFLVMHVRRPPGSQVVHRFGDKIVHAVAYLVLALLGGWVAARWGRCVNRRWVIRWLLIYAAYAAADELLQPLIGRTCQLGDWFADLGGTAAALILIWGLSYRRRPRD